MQGMPLRRSTAAALAAAALTASLFAGCSKEEKSSAPLPDATTLLKQSAETTRALKSAHLDLNVEGKVENLTIKTLSGDLANEPAVAAQGRTKITLPGGDVDAEFRVVGGTLYAALDPNQWSDFGPAKNVFDVSVILNPDTGLANILSNFKDPKAEDRETINGVQSIKITGQVPLEAVDKIAPKIASTPTVPGTVWIREDGNHDLVQAKLEPTPGNSVQMTLSKWNEPVSVEKPPGV